MKYFISKNGKKRGPYEIEEIKEMKLFNTVLVWREGMNEWQPAKDIEELNNKKDKPGTVPSLFLLNDETLKKTRSGLLSQVTKRLKQIDVLKASNASESHTLLNKLQDEVKNYNLKLSNAENEMRNREVP